MKRVTTERRQQVNAVAKPDFFRGAKGTKNIHIATPKYSANANKI